MFELTAADHCMIEEQIIRDFRQKRFLREGDLAVNEALKVKMSSNPTIRDLADKEITKAKNDVRQFTIAIAVHENRYDTFKKLADQEAEAEENDRAVGDMPIPFPKMADA